jgi:hypothetical protein
MAKKKKRQPARTPPKTKPSPAKLAGIQSPLERLRLKHIRLLDLTSHLEIHGGKVPVQASIQYSLGVGASADGNVHVNASLDLDGRPVEEGENSSVVKISISYQLVYEIIDGSKVEDFSEHGAVIGTAGMFVVWPYIRELVQSLTARMSIPPLILPTFSVKVREGASGKLEFAPSNMPEE